MTNLFCNRSSRFKWWVFFAMIVTSVCALKVVVFVMQRLSSIHFLRAEMEKGLSCEWQTHNGKRVSDEKLLNSTLLLWGGPVNLQMTSPDYRSSDYQKLGQVVGSFHTLNELGIQRGQPSDITRFFIGLGRQDSLSTLYMFGASTEDSISAHLDQFPNLRVAGFVPSKITGEGFPALVQLEQLDLTASDMTKIGFGQVLKLPRLKWLRFSSPNFSAFWIDRLLDSDGHITNIQILESKLTREDVERALKQYRHHWPTNRLEIDYQ